MASAHGLDKIAELYEAILEPAWEDGSFRGVLPFHPRWIDVLVGLESEGSLDFIQVDGRSRSARSLHTLAEGTHVFIQLTRPGSLENCFVPDLAALLRNSQLRYTAPASFYIADQRRLYPRDADGPGRLYYKAIDLIALLREISAHAEVRAGEMWLVFLLHNGRKLDFPVRYETDDLVELADQDVAAFASLVTTAPHREVKQGLLRSALAELLSAVHTHERCSSILRGFQELSRRFNENFDLYLAEFSFENERDKLSDMKREYLLKLNAAVSDINAKLVAIPVSVVLVAGQMKVGKETATVVGNMTLLFGAVLFTALMFVVISNQAHSLKAIHSDYESRRGRLERDLKGLYTQIAQAFKDLDHRYRQQLRLLRWVRIALLIGLGCSVVVFWLYLETPAEDSIGDASSAETPNADPARARVDSAYRAPAIVPQPVDTPRAISSVSAPPSDSAAKPSRLR